MSHQWYWQSWQETPDVRLQYLKCDLLDPWCHGFFTRAFAPRSPQELTPALQAGAAAYRTQQVHGNCVRSTAEIEALPPDEGTLLEGDGIVTLASQQAVWTCSADCTPVAIADAGSGRVAAVHAGWRGTAAKVVPVAIARLQQAGSRVENLCVALGPAISGEVYQVETPVAERVGATIAPEDPLSALRDVSEPALFPDPMPGKVRLDLRRAIALQLQALGVKSDRIAIAPYCTYLDGDRFFSYRRDRQKSVQWSGIVSRMQTE